MAGSCDIEFVTLIDYVEGELEGEARAHLESHLASGCLLCRRNLTWLHRTIHLMRADDSVEPPRWVFERARRLFRDRRAGRWNWAKRVAAILLFDSGLQPSPAGVRSGETGMRQVLYGTEDFDIDLLVERVEGSSGTVERPVGQQVNLSGQILPRGDLQGNGLAYEITVVREGERVFSGRVSSLGEFNIIGLDRGTYDLIISLEDGELYIEGFEV